MSVLIIEVCDNVIVGFNYYFSTLYLEMVEFVEQWNPSTLHRLSLKTGGVVLRSQTHSLRGAYQLIIISA